MTLGYLLRGYLGSSLRAFLGSRRLSAGVGHPLGPNLPHLDSILIIIVFLCSGHFETILEVVVETVFCKALCYWVFVGAFSFIDRGWM